MKAGILGQRVAPRGDLRQTLDRPVVLPVRIIAITGQIELLAAHRAAQLFVVIHISERVRIIALMEVCLAHDT